MTDRIPALQRSLSSHADPVTKDWWERYLKHTIDFRGVKMADIRSAVHRWHEGDGLDVALALIREPMAEDKLAGILLLQEILLPTVAWPEALPLFAELFDDGSIYEWNTCDWFCVRVLGPMADAHGELCARAIAEWRHAGNLWRRRSAGVAFVNLAKRGDENFAGFTDMLLEVCRHTVQDPARFAQTGTGWVLRELSVAAPEAVAGFVDDHRELMSTEAHRSTTRKLRQPE